MENPNMQETEMPLASEETTGSTGQAVMELLAGFSLEITNAVAQQSEDISSLIPAGTQVYLPFLPDSAFAECVPAACSVMRNGMTPVPHIAARRLTGQAELENVLGLLRDTASVTSVLVIAGDANRPAGPYASAMEVLETGLLEQYGITEIGIAGYPEGHPSIAEDVIWSSLTSKCDYAKTSSADFRIVSQFTFSHRSVLNWEEKLKQAGITLPVHLSVPGPARLSTLLGYAKTCGVTAAFKQLIRNRKNMASLAAIKTPDALLSALAHHRSQAPGTLIRNIHFNTFGGFEETARWVGAIRQGRFTMTGDESRFNVTRS